MECGTVTNMDINLYWVAEGDPERPAVLLINGGGSTLPMWCRELIDPILEAGYRVVRFDNRDIGRSSWVPDIRYTIEDMADDASAVLDAVGADAAHLVGRSMGGLTAQWMALKHRGRVRSLTLIYTTPSMTDDRLPQSTPSARTQTAAEAVEPATAEDRMKVRMDSNRFYAGTRFPFDEAWSAAEAQLEVDHAPWNLPGHFRAVRNTPSLVDRLGEISAPTLVLHGDADPIVPVEHGRHLGANIAGASYHEFAGLSHELPPAFCTEIRQLLLDHFQSTELQYWPLIPVSTGSHRRGRVGAAPSVTP